VFAEFENVPVRPQKRNWDWVLVLVGGRN